MLMTLPDRLETPAHLPVDQWEGKWFILGVASRLERQTVRALEIGEGVRCFWPREKLYRFENGADGRKRRRLIERSLFPSYISCCAADAGQEYAVRSYRPSWLIIPIINRERFVRDLVRVDYFLDKDVKIESTVSSHQGTRVRVKHGPFQGYEGTVEDGESGPMFVIEISLLGSLRMLSICPTDLEPL